MKEKIIETKRLQLDMLSNVDLAVWLRSKTELEEKTGYKFVEEILSLHLRNVFNIKIHNIEEDPDNIFWYTYFAIVLKSINSVIGMIGFKDIPDNENASEVGYGINNQFTGKGYATEALKGLADYTFKTTNLFVIKAETYVENTASQHVLEKNKFILLEQDEYLKKYELKKKE